MDLQAEARKGNNESNLYSKTRLRPCVVKVERAEAKVIFTTWFSLYFLIAIPTYNLLGPSLKTTPFLSNQFICKLYRCPCVWIRCLYSQLWYNPLSHCNKLLIPFITIPFCFWVWSFAFDWQNPSPKSMVMGLSYQSNRAGALAGVFVLLFPVFLPGLFSPLGHASPSTFSVSLCHFDLLSCLFCSLKLLNFWYYWYCFVKLFRKCRCWFCSRVSVMRKVFLSGEVGNLFL